MRRRRLRGVSPAFSAGPRRKLVLHLHRMQREGEGEGDGKGKGKGATRIKEWSRYVHTHAAAAAQCGRTIHLLHKGKLMTHTLATYRAWREQNRSVRVIAEEGFEYDRDVVFEETLSPLYRTFHSWRGVLLDGWWFDRHKTGLMTVPERLVALIERLSMSPSYNFQR